jgi:predicted phage terminase large subunit-like protein
MAGYVDPRLLSNPELLDAANLQRELCSRHLRDYAKRAWPWVEPDPLIWNWHLDCYSEHLEAVSNGQITKLAMNVPPGCSKSLFVSVLWPTWEWTRRPEGRWFFASYDQTLSTRDSVKCRNLIASRWYQQRWGHVFSLQGDQNQKTYYETSKQGWRLATTPRGHGTGQHPDRVVVDDPLSADDASSEAERRSVATWWSQTMATRGAARGVRSVLIMQRLHEEDLTAEVLKEGGWTHIVLPMRYEPKRMMTTPLGWNDPRTKPGELLAPKQYPLRLVEDLEKRLKEYGTAGQLQQRPSPAGGGVIKDEWWQTYTDAPKDFDQVICSWDLAMKNVEDADYSVGLVIGRKGALLYVLDCIRERMDAPQQLKQIKALANRWPSAAAKLIEDKANGPAVIQLLRLEVPGIIAVKADASTGGKQARLMAVSPLIEARQVYLPKGIGWADDLRSEASAFPLGAHDDMLDALSQGLSWLMAAAYMHVPEKPKDERPLEVIRQEALWSRIRQMNQPEEETQSPARYGGAW